MYNRPTDLETYELRLKAHEEQNKCNAKRKKAGKQPIDSFPKQEFKVPYDINKMKNLKTFIPADEFEKVKLMKVPELLQYLFRNMLIYECNLIFDNNFALAYNYHTIKISRDNYRRIFYVASDKIPDDCYIKDKYLYFTFNLSYLRSFNKRYNTNENGKAKQYILFNFSFIYVALRCKAARKSNFILSPKAKDFLLLIISLYKFSDYPRIKHSLPKLLEVCNISLKQSKQTAIDRINRYFKYLYDYGLLGDNFRNYTFTVDDLSCGRSLNIDLLPIIKYY